MASGVNLPNVSQVLDIADDFGLELTQEDAESYCTLLQGAVKSYRRIDEMVEYRPPVKYPRSPGYRPAPEDNPCNGWYWKSRIEGAPNGPLHGKTVGIKDAICVAGVPMMNGSRILEGFMPDIDATVVTRLLDAGATILGKTNSEDCCFSGSGHTCAMGPVGNPYQPDHAPGGSSNGSAVVLATNEADLALGGDQGGSIRMPAAWSGVVGHKPSYGLVPYTGCMMIEMTLDHVGPMANSVEDVAAMLSAIVGPDHLDPRQRGVIPEDFVNDYLPAIDKGIDGLRIAIVKEGFEQAPWTDLGLGGSEEAVDESVRAAAKRLGALGASVEEVSIPMHIDGAYIFTAIIREGATDFMVKGYNTGTNWQGFYNTGLLDAVARGFNSRPNDLPVTVKTVMLMGEYMKRYYHGRYYAKAQNLRASLVKAYDDVLSDYDVLLMPTIPFQATVMPSPDCSIIENMSHALNMTNNTCQFNVTGHPAISVPCGMEGGLPVGCMLIGRHFDDLTVLQVADTLEKSGNWKSF